MISSEVAANSLTICSEMENYLNENFGEVKPKNSSDEALQRWRKLCWSMKNPKQRFRYAANLSNRFEAEAIQRSNQNKPSMEMQITLGSQLRSNSQRRITHSTETSSTEQMLLESQMRSRSQTRSQSRCSIGMAFLVIINLLLEIVSAFTEQLYSIHKPYLARISLIMSMLSVVLVIVELTRKIEHQKVHFRWKWPIPWFYYQSGDRRIFGRLEDIVLLFCVVGQLIVSTINCSFIERGSDSPIKISLWPLFFAIGMAISMLKDYIFDLTQEVEPDESL